MGLSTKYLVLSHRPRDAYTHNRRVEMCTQALTQGGSPVRVDPNPLDRWP